MRTLVTTLACALLLALVPSCGDDSGGLKQIGDGLEQAWEGLKTFTAETRDKAVPYFQEQLDGLGEEFAAAKKKAAALGEDASIALQARWDDASKRLAELETATEEQWDKAQAAFVAAYEAFRRELEKDGKQGP